MKEFKIGDIFEYGLVKLQCVKNDKENSPFCAGCFFSDIRGCLAKCVGPCNSHGREDGEYVKFMRVYDEDLTQTRNDMKMISISKLYERFPEFFFFPKVAELCGFNPNLKWYAVIDDGMRTSGDGTWVVHIYDITNEEFNPFSEIKAPTENDGYKILEESINLAMDEI